jgi:hypothetical protein
MMAKARECFAEIFKKSARDLDMHMVYDVAHNIAKVEQRILFSFSFLFFLKLYFQKICLNVFVGFASRVPQFTRLICFNNLVQIFHYIPMSNIG